jgi:hypothetical protein
LNTTSAIKAKNFSGYGAIENCQICGSTALISVLFLGYLPPVNLMRPLDSRAKMEQSYPAELLQCAQCRLVQLGYSVDPHLLFPPEYPYTSGSTRILRENFAELYREVGQRVGLNENDLIVDIGSNDGTLLSNFQQNNYRVAGIEPTLTAKIAEERGIPTVMAFFDEKSVAEIQQRFGTPRIVTAANVFAHIHNIHEVVDCIEDLVGTGVFISESHYVRDVIEGLQYDTIYHEHLRYYSLGSLQHLLAGHGFRIFHAKRIPTHGGSIRVYASKSKQHPLQDSVSRILAEEEAIGLAGDSWIAAFRNRVSRSKLFMN